MSIIAEFTVPADEFALSIQHASSVNWQSVLQVQTGTWFV
jgi:hypothetical protein